ncbi:acyl-CoA dehydrogenase [Aeromicrobium sp. 636]|uniref:Acyl-CoA dehydrogenase family protein n=2 Tax=Nocardioidaceae TaxID=85015 RepID=A0A8I0JYK3_9ACTN|nr:acyl-CoA dehydrogenase family protein [Aeromicrobium senzhongii]MBC9224962.1 acyl-CoA dehydrogenase family protein [Aeromicrobium senzhongii]MCQ3997073.1 acyl-CoA dehydrogenase [Aeromicrobium sp. 636]
MAYGLRVLNKLAASETLDRFGLRKFAERAVHGTTKTSFQAIGAAQRTFTKVSGHAQGDRPAAAQPSGVFDLTPTEDQQMMVDVISEFAAEVLRPGAEQAEHADDTPKEVLAQTAEFGLSLINIPESLGGLAEERSAVTGVLVAEALAHGDMGQAVACLAPSAVATAISLWGTEGQQQTYLPPFTEGDVPAAALVVAEPVPMFDPLTLGTVARRTDGGYVLNGLKSGAVRGAEAELLVVAADVEGRGPSMVIVEANTDGVAVAADPGMGLRAAGLSRIQLTDVRVGEDAILGSPEDYRTMIRLSRLAWAGLALGTAKSVLEYVKEYVVTREAFGEPIAYRQAVAFTVADMAIELEGMRLVTLKAASRAERGSDFARETALARRLATEYGMKIGTDGVQMLGGHGFVKEHPVERWYRDLRAVGVMEGAVLI